MNAFALTFVAFALAALAWRLWLLARHARHVARHRDRVPPDFADLVPPDAHARAADYTRDKVRVAAVEAVAIDGALLLALSVGGGLAAIDALSAAALGSGYARDLATVFGFVAVGAAASLPFDAWRTFRVEARHGFNQTTPATFLADDKTAPAAQLITIIGRGHSGTRAMSHTLSQSGVYMGDTLNKSGDLLPPEAMYEACRVMARHVMYKGSLQWDFSKLHTMPIDPKFTKLIESYLASVLTSPAARKGWKIPETTLAFPWIVRMFPDAHYIHWVRDQRDSILGSHITDDLSDFGVPYDKTDDVRLRRAVSWVYQAEIGLTPPTAFEDNRRSFYERHRPSPFRTRNTPAAPAVVLITSDGLKTAWPMRDRYA